MKFQILTALSLFIISSVAYTGNITCPAGVAILNDKQAQQVYAELKKLENIPYKYVVDGCDVRAYLGAKHLYEKAKLKSFRVNIESYPSMYVDTPYTFEKGVDFFRHSVLAFCSQKEGKLEPIIFDISFYEKPVSLKEWQDKLIDPRFIDADKFEVFTSSMFSLDPTADRKSEEFSRQDLNCAESVRSRFMIEQRKIESGALPYGVGRSKEIIRSGLCN